MAMANGGQLRANPVHGINTARMLSLYPNGHSDAKSSAERIMSIVKINPKKLYSFDEVRKLYEANYHERISLPELDRIASSLARDSRVFLGVDKENGDVKYLQWFDQVTMNSIMDNLLYEGLKGADSLHAIGAFIKLVLSTDFFRNIDVYLFNFPITREQWNSIGKNQEQIVFDGRTLQMKNLIRTGSAEPSDYVGWRDIGKEIGAVYNDLLARHVPFRYVANIKEEQSTEGPIFPKSVVGYEAKRLLNPPEMGYGVLKCGDLVVGVYKLNQWEEKSSRFTRNRPFYSPNGSTEADKANVNTSFENLFQKIASAVIRIMSETPSLNIAQKLQEEENRGLSVENYLQAIQTDLNNNSHSKREVFSPIAFYPGSKIIPRTLSRRGARYDKHRVAIELLPHPHQNLTEAKITNLTLETFNIFKAAWAPIIQGTWDAEAENIFMEYIRENYIRNAQMMAFVRRQGDLHPLGFASVVKIDVTWANHSVPVYVLAGTAVAPELSGLGLTAILNRQILEYVMRQKTTGRRIYVAFKTSTPLIVGQTIKFDNVFPSFLHPERQATEEELGIARFLAANWAPDVTFDPNTFVLEGLLKKGIGIMKRDFIQWDSSMEVNTFCKTNMNYERGDTMVFVAKLSRWGLLKRAITEWFSHRFML